LRWTEKGAPKGADFGRWSRWAVRPFPRGRKQADRILMAPRRPTPRGAKTDLDHLCRRSNICGPVSSPGSVMKLTINMPLD